MQLRELKKEKILILTYIQSTVRGVLEREDVDWPIGVIPAAEDGYEADGGAGEPDDNDGDEESSLADVSSVAKWSGDGPKAGKIINDKEKEKGQYITYIHTYIHFLLRNRSFRSGLSRAQLQTEFLLTLPQGGFSVA